MSLEHFSKSWSHWPIHKCFDKISINSSSSSIRFSYSQILKIVEIPRKTHNGILFKRAKGRNYYLPSNLCVNLIFFFSLFLLTHTDAIDIIAKTQISISDTFFFILLQFFFFLLLFLFTHQMGEGRKNFSKRKKQYVMFTTMKQEWNVYF